MKKVTLIFINIFIAYFVICSAVLADDSADWYPSKYGKDDTRGALNLIDEEKVKAALGMIKENKVYDLGMEYYDGFPAYPPRYWKTWILSHGMKTPLGKNKLVYLEEMCNISLGIGTQVDGLAHVGIGNKFYNGNSYEDVAGADQLKKFGIENIFPVITKGVLLDMAAYKGKDILDPSEEITVEDIEGCLKKQKVKIERGDIVLFYTGWSKLIQTDPEKFGKSEPGIGLEAAKYLVEKEVAMTGSDTWGF